MTHHFIFPLPPFILFAASQWRMRVKDVENKTIGGNGYDRKENYRKITFLYDTLPIACAVIFLKRDLCSQIIATHHDDE